MTAKQLILTEENPYTVLTIIQKRYVEARLQGLNQMSAGRAAGMSFRDDDRSTVYKMEKNPKVRAAIRFLIKESTKSIAELQKNDVLQGMMDAVEAAANSGELVMAWREVGKLLGAYEPERRVLEIHDYTQEELKTLSDKDLMQLAGGKMKNIVDGEYHEVD